MVTLELVLITVLALAILVLAHVTARELRRISAELADIRTRCDAMRDEVNEMQMEQVPPAQEPMQ